MITILKNIIDVPHEFIPKQLKPYPVDNEIPFEEWFFKNYNPDLNKSDRVYLPVQWTAFFCNNRHGKNRRSLRHLQSFLDGLDRRKKYFTVVQYDDGILNDISKLDIKVFGMGCKSSEGTAQLPLVCQPHKYEFKETGRPIFASFIGSITHPIREQMVKELQGKEGYFISTEHTSLHSYCYIMSQSKYVLCPRGYGKTSFRIAESLQYGAKPIYITGKDSILFSSGCYIGLADSFTITEIMDNVKNNEVGIYTDSDVNKMRFNLHYTYEAVANRIYENLKL